MSRKVCGVGGGGGGVTRVAASRGGCSSGTARAGVNSLGPMTDRSGG